MIRAKAQRFMMMGLICCVFFTPVAAQQSMLLKWAKEGIDKLFPNITEISWVSGSVNVLYQTMQLARTTLSVYRRYQESYANLLETINSIEAAFNNLENLYYNFDPYNMDSWAATLRGAQYIIDYDCYGALYAWGAVEFISATTDFMFSADSIFNDMYRHRKNREFVDEYYFSQNIDSLRSEYMRVMRDYTSMTNANIEREIRMLQGMLDDDDPNIVRMAEARIDSLEAVASEFQGRAYVSAINHADTLMNFIRDMVVYNITEIHIIETKIGDYEYAADFLVEQFYTLKDGVGDNHRRVVDTTRHRDLGGLPTSFDLSGVDTMSFHPTDPDRLPRPPSGMFETKETPKFSLKKEVSYHDIAHLQNGIDFILLQQEMAIRDLAMIRARSSAVIMAARAYNDHTAEMAYMIHLDRARSFHR